MGVGLHMLGAVAPGSGGAAALAPEVAAELREAAVRALPELAGYARVARERTEDTDSDLLIRLHPAEEEARVSVHQGHVLLSARTNGAGPGYHAFLVRLMDEVARAVAVRWLAEATIADESYCDETGYFAGRDFAALQTEMLHWLRNVAESISGGEVGEGPWLLSLPVGTPIPADGAAAFAPTGRYSVEWLGELAAADDDRAAAMAASFFPWWHDRPDGSTLEGLGRAALALFPWHPPADADERAAGELALACLGGQAGAVRDVEELRLVLAGDPDQPPVPARDGLGLLRGPVERTPFERCVLVLPGYFYQRSDEDSTARIYWHGDRVVRATCWRIEGGAGPQDPEALVMKSAREALGDEPLLASFDFAREDDGMRAFAAVYGPAPDEDPPLHVAHAAVVAGPRLLLLTVSFRQPADREWVRSLVSSVRLYADADEDGDDPS
jgi:hypothetical protein